MLVHEASHARLDQAGHWSYAENRERHEKICRGKTAQPTVGSVGRFIHMPFENTQSCSRWRRKEEARATGKRLAGITRQSYRRGHQPANVYLEAPIVDPSQHLPPTIESTGVALADATTRLAHCASVVVIRDLATQEAWIVATSPGTDRRLLGMRVSSDSAAARACDGNVIGHAAGIGELLGVTRPDRRKSEDTGVAWPLRDGDKTVGAVVLFAPPDSIADSIQSQLDSLATRAGRVLGKLVAAQFARQVGLIDAITGHLNLPGLKKAMRESASKRCSLVCVVVDQIMALEADRENAILRQIGSILRSNIRDYDVLARTGAEEFAMFLPNVALDGALVVSDRVRSAVSKTDFDLGRDLAVTCSLGVAAVPDTVSAIDKLIDAASAGRQTPP